MPKRAPKKVEHQVTATLRNWELTRRESAVEFKIKKGKEMLGWSDFGRALDGALQVVDDGGAIVLCTELSEPPGKALEALARIEDRDVAAAEIRKARPLDAFAALLLDRAQRLVRVYLLSKLDATVVEELGMAPIDAPADVARLATRRKSCIVLCDAQYAAPRVL